MEMKNINAGRLRAIGYDPKSRTLHVRFDDGSLLEYAGIGDALWDRFTKSSAQWSFYRDNIEEEFTPRRISAKPAGGKNPLDDLFS